MHGRPRFCSSSPQTRNYVTSHPQHPEDVVLEIENRASLRCSRTCPCRFARAEGSPTKQGERKPIRNPGAALLRHMSGKAAFAACAWTQCTYPLCVPAKEAGQSQRTSGISSHFAFE